MKYLGLFLCLALFACGDDDGTPPDAGDDAGMDAGDDAGMDAGDDVGPLEDSYLFGPCVTDEQCPGDGAFCRQPEDGYNYGTCTVSCVNRIPCDDGRIISWCLENPTGEGSACEFRCRNSVDCGRDNYLCVDVDELDSALPGGRCIGYCREDSDCGLGAECHAQAARCVARGTVPTEGALTNAACTADSECNSGSCVLPVMNGNATGQLGGSCESVCAIGPGFNSSNFYLADTLPTGHCPNADDICLPVGQTSTGSEGACYDACTEESDCREGRTCLRTIAEHTFTNGVCIPIDCTARSCPDGHTCQTFNVGGGRQIGRCRPE